MIRYLKKVGNLAGRALLISRFYRRHFITSYAPGYILFRWSSLSILSAYVTKLRIRKIARWLELSRAPQIVEITDDPGFQKRYDEAERVGNFSALVSEPINRMVLSPQQLLKLSHAFFSNGKLDAGNSCIDDAFRTLRATQPHDPPDAIALLGLDWTGALGHVIGIEAFLQLRDLGETPYERVIVLSPAAPQPNRVLLQRIVRSHHNVKLLESSTSSQLQRTFLPFTTTQNCVRNRTGVFHNTFSFLDTSSWLTYERRAPSHHLISDEMRSLGIARLREWGITENDEIVCLHARSGSASPGRGLANVDVASYSMAIKKITDSGQWVIRMGDSHMPPLPLLPRVVDYAHHRDRSPWMDVYLWSRATFAIGTNSGGSEGFKLFHTPVIQTNCTTPFVMPFAAKSFFLPKLYQRRGTDAPMALQEVASSPWGWGDAMSHVGWEDVSVLDNTPEEIADAVDEMQKFLSTGSRYLPDSAFQRRLMDLRADVGRSARSVISDSFMSRHPGLV